MGTLKSKQQQIQRLTTLILFRIITVTAILATSAIMSFRSADWWTPTQQIMLSSIGLMYLISILYLLAVKYNENFLLQSIAQIFGDLLFWSCMVYITGGLSSPFTFLYNLTIILSSLVFRKRGIVGTTITSCLMLLGLTWMESNKIFFETLQLQSATESLFEIEVIYRFFLNVCMFSLIAVLSYYIAGQVRSSEDSLVQQQLNLDEQKRLNRSIIQGMRSGLLMAGLDGKIHFINRALRKMVGKEDEDLPNDLIGLFPVLRECFRLEQWGRPWARKFEGEVKVGNDRRWLFFHFADLLDAFSEKDGILLIVEDRTETQRLKERIFQNEKLAALGKLAAGIAHEIRNPLASISGSLQMLRMEYDTEDDNSRLMEISLQETERLNRLINDFLSFARPMDPTFETVDLKDVFEELKPLIKNQDMERDIEVTWSTPPDVSTRIEADNGQIRQMMWNVISNAIHALKRGAGTEGEAPRVDVMAMVDPEYDIIGGRLLLAIQDNGCGMSADVVEKLFDPFFTTRAEGSGLGMSIVFQIIEAHHGTIEIDSEPGRGTTMLIRLPRSQQDSDMANSSTQRIKVVS